MLGIVAELNARRIAMVMGKRQRRLGGLFLVSQKQLGLLTTARKLHHRYLQDHYQHDETELAAVRDLAYWLLEEHRLNENIKNPTPFHFNMREKSAKEPPAAGTYRVYLQRVFDL